MIIIDIKNRFRRLIHSLNEDISNIQTTEIILINSLNFFQTFRLFNFDIYNFKYIKIAEIFLKKSKFK